MQAFLYFSRVAICLVLWASPLAMAHDASDLPNGWVSGDANWEVRYSMQNPYNCGSLSGSADRNFLPSNVALQMVQALDSGGASVPGTPAGYHPGYLDLGFQDPPLASREDGHVLVHDCAPGGEHDPDDDCDSGNAPEDLINMPATVYCGAMEIVSRLVIGHELFHHVQYGYIGFSDWPEWGEAAIEGSARMMEDLVYDDIDGNANLQFNTDVTNYLDNPNRDFWISDYKAALGWKYAAEQYGQIQTEPQYGVDFVRRFWENAAANADNPDFSGTFAETIGQTSGDSLKTWFQDFSIANVAKEFDTSLLPNPDRYRYVDEADGNGVTFSNVARSWTGPVPGPLVAGLQDVRRWGAAYLQGDIAGTCSDRMIVGARLGGDYSGQAVLAIDSQNRVSQLIKGAGKDMSASFIQRSGNKRYTSLIAVITGRNDFVTKIFDFDCGIGQVQIRRPDATFKTYVGPYDDPRTFILRLVVTGPQALGNPTVLGLQPSDFEVYVGNNHVFDDEATVVTGLYVQGEYWLQVRAPEKNNDDTYNLYVNLGASLTASQPNSVSYEERIVDQMLLIDTSGSMISPQASPPIDAAINAASLFTDVTHDEDFIGLATFAGDDIEPNFDATLQQSLDPASESQREAVKSKLANLTASGFTSIGDGLDLAASEFPGNGSPLGEDWIVLLSDGMENEGQFWDNVKNSLGGIRISTIALGPDADQVLLDEIATVTGGEYYYVDTGALAARAGSGATLSLPNLLADTYASASELAKRHERLWEFDGALAAGAGTTYTLDIDEGGIVDTTFAVNWNDPATTLNVDVIRPDLSVVTDGVAGASVRVAQTHVVTEVPALTPGTWQVKLTATAGEPEFIGVLAGHNRQGASLNIFFTQYYDDPFAQSLGAQALKGLPQPVMALLTDDAGVIGNATVVATVEHANGSTLTLPLFDDGEHSDGNANDGVYGNLYTPTTAASDTNLPDAPGNGTRGSYNVKVVAQGADNNSLNFTRIRKASFQVFDSQDPPSDTDDDGMPDRYEYLHACLDELQQDEEVDSDDDRLLNGDEWRRGTDPCHPDTDRGGESDFSEVTRGANPFDPADDALPRPTYVEVIDWRLDHVPFSEPNFLRSKTNLIRYPASLAYNQIHLQRATSPNGPFLEVAVFNASANHGLYRDVDLQNDVTYYYKIQADDLNGNLSAPSHVFVGTPKLDPVPPIGSIVINGGALVTTSADATLTLNASPDTTEMMIANNGAFTGAIWQPFQPSTMHGLVPNGSQATVFARYRDPDQNESAVYADSITVAAPAQVGSIRGGAGLAGNSDSSNVYVTASGPSSALPDFTDPAGKYRINNLAPGAYTVKLSYPGYESAVFNDVVATGGSTTTVQDVLLVAIDSDSDGVVDIDDNCTLIANADQRDTNGDGFGNICDPDLNGDMQVNFIDLGLLKSVFFTADANADFNGDGAVNFIDLAQMKLFFFGKPGPAGAVQ